VVIVIFMIVAVAGSDGSRAGSRSDGTGLCSRALAVPVIAMGLTTDRVGGRGARVHAAATLGQAEGQEAEAEEGSECRGSHNDG
jgi:hypothetical protein